MCFIVSMAYDYETRIGQLILAPEGCTDMTGAIGVFLAVDPNVERVETIGTPECQSTTYQRTTYGWRMVEKGGYLSRNAVTLPKAVGE